jgi:hypothetical protein
MSIKAMQQALEALKAVRHGHCDHAWADEAIADLDAAIEAAEKREPMAFIAPNGDLRKTTEAKDHWEWGAEFTPLYTTPPAAQPAPEDYTALEQALYRMQKGYFELHSKVAAQPAPEFECPRCGHCCPQRQWVGLTGDERKKIYHEHYPYSLATTITAVEAKLKEKNT